MSGTEEETGSSGSEEWFGESAKRKLIEASFRGDLDALRAALREGASVDTVDPRTGLAPLHIAAGTNNQSLAAVLIEEAGASFFADRHGRWPSLIAIECEASPDLAEYITTREERFLIGQVN